MSPEQLHLFENPLQRARRLKAKGDLAGAKKLLLDFLRGSPENLSALAALADIHYRSGDYKQALVLAGKILRLDPQDPRALVVTGNALLKKKKPAEALEAFRAALTVAETDYLWLRAARCLLELRRPEEAKAAMERARAGEGGWELWRLEMQLAGMEKDPAREEEILKQAAAAADAQPERFAEQMLYLLSTCPPKRAAELSALARALGAQPQNPWLILAEAGNLLRARDGQTARERLGLLEKQKLPAGLEKRVFQLQKRLRT